jgi:hypothetical protein
MPGALLTDRSVREFREWLKSMPPSRFERRVTGACDASMPDEQAGQQRLKQFVALLRAEGVPLLRALPLFAFLREKFCEDDAQANELWRWLAGYAQRERYRPEDVRAFLRSAATRLPRDAFVHAWEFIQPRIERDRAPARNGHAV